MQFSFELSRSSLVGHGFQVWPSAMLLLLTRTYTRSSAFQLAHLRAMIPAVAPELQGHPRTNQQSRISHELQSHLRAMIPAVAPELQGHPRTNQQSRICHELQFAMPRNRNSHNSEQRSFPSAIVEDWNRLPPELITAPITLHRLQQFKEGVHKYLRSAGWHWASTHL